MRCVGGGKLPKTKSRNISHNNHNRAEYELGKYRYAELRSFCRQYADKKAEAELLLSIKAQVLTGMPSAHNGSDSTYSAVERREHLLSDCEMIEECAKAVQNGLFYHAIMTNVCMGKAYDYIPQEMLPTSKRNAFFAARREFFRLLDKVKR